MSALRPFILFASAAVLAAGCGGDSETTTTTPSPQESADRAQLPRSWQRHTNFDAGISLGVPPLWHATDRGIRTVVNSPDRLLAITVTADRTDEAIELDLAGFATRVANSLGNSDSVEPGPPEAFGHRYPAVAIEAGFRTEAGVEQNLLVVVLERERLVKATALVAWNRARARERDIRDARRMVRTIRTRPVA